MKELLKIAQTAQKVNNVRYLDLGKDEFTGLDLVIPAIQEDVTVLSEKEQKVSPK